MPTRQEVNYFGAGPAPLPTEVLEEASKALLNYKDMGIGLAEMSHRSPEANEILKDAKDALVALYDIPEDYEILFLQGGGSGEFSAVVYHMVSIWVERERVKFEKSLQGSTLESASDEEKFSQLAAIVKRNLRLDYLVTGSWSLKASQEAARLIGSEYVNVAFDAREHNGGKFGSIPVESAWKLRRPQTDSASHEQVQSALTYFCDNETVDGVEFPGFPSVLESQNDADDRHVVADMSSNFLSRRVDVKKYSIIFGGAQKNIGSTGVALCIIRKSLLPPNVALASPVLLRKLGLPIGPVVFDYPTIAKNNSLYNTLPIFDVWIAGQVMKGLVKQHGSAKISGQEAISNKKALLIYETLEKHSSVYHVVPEKAVRSRMNICLRVKQGNADAEKEFLAGAQKLGLTGLKGHRSVGGIRISNYNAVTVEGVEKLVKYLEEYAQRG